MLSNSRQTIFLLLAGKKQGNLLTIIRMLSILVVLDKNDTFCKSINMSQHILILGIIPDSGPFLPHRDACKSIINSKKGADSFWHGNCNFIMK